MKKLLIVSVFVFAFALTANVAFAHDGCCFPIYQSCCPKVDINASNYASITNNISSNSNTGYNTILGKGASLISTGAAWSSSTAYNNANVNQITVYKPLQGTVSITANNGAGVTNTVTAYSNTGYNNITSCDCQTHKPCGGGGCSDPCPCPTSTIWTGGSTSGSYATTLLNSNVIFVP